jgi:hypothetical protein
MISQVLQTINDFATYMPWDALLAAGIISPTLVGFKKWLSIQSERVMILLVILVSLGTVTSHYLLTVPTHDPSIIGVQTAVLAFMTQPVFFFIVKPAIAFFRSEVEKAAALNLDIRSAAVETPTVQ